VSPQELVAVWSAVVAGLFIILWLRRVATREDDCDACIVEERIGRNVPDDMHDCEIGEEVES